MCLPTVNWKPIDENLLEDFIQTLWLKYAYSAAGGSLNANHECEVAQQQRDGQVEVDKQVDSVEQPLPAIIMKQELKCINNVQFKPECRKSYWDRS